MAQRTKISGCISLEFSIVPIAGLHCSWRNSFQMSPDKTYKLCISRKRRGDAEDTGIFQRIDTDTGYETSQEGEGRSEQI